MFGIHRLAYRIREFLMDPVLRRKPEIISEPTAQIGLKIIYRQLLHSGTPLPRLNEVGFKVFSQTDEDGILLFIFSVIGTTNRLCVEICAGNGIECNTSNLIINHGWTGLLVDGNADLVRKGNEFYKANRATYVFPPTFLHAWITRDNINEILKNNHCQGQIDLLSIDMDGVDYWIWDAIEIIAPRVVVAEYQDIIPADVSVTVPYSDDFKAADYPTTRGLPNFCGASLLAFTRLARVKGYRLVGVSRFSVNAFFIRADIAAEVIPEVSVNDCLTHPKAVWGMQERFPVVSHLPWQSV